MKYFLSTVITAVCFFFIFTSNREFFLKTSKSRTPASQSTESLDKVNNHNYNQMNKLDETQTSNTSKVQDTMSNNPSADVDEASEDAAREAMNFGGNIPAANVAVETNLNSNADAALNVNIDDEIKQGLAIQAFSIEDVEAYKKQRLSNLEIENEQLELENSEILGE